MQVLSVRTAAVALLLCAARPAAAAETDLPPPRPALPDFAQDIEARKSYAIPAAEIVVFDSLLNFFDRHFVGDEYKSNARSVRRNLRSTWVVDSDPFTVNQLGHPYQGSMYHGFARASGLDYWQGLGYTFLGSALWEIAGETTTPSRNDQINTGIGGTFLGEALFRMANLTLEHEHPSSFWREVAAAAISPPVGVNRVAFGDRFRYVFPSHDPVYFTRFQVGYSGSAQGDGAGVSTVSLKRHELQGDFFMDYGLPGKRGYEYTRPFDYFSFQATASSANGFENVMTRGLLIGRDYAAGDRYRGVLGLYGNYDYIAPQTFRVSTTGVSLGTTGQWWASDRIALQGTGLLGVGYAAAGTEHATSDRDYHYGVAPQALLNLRTIVGPRWALDVTAREYFVSRLGAAARGGHENIMRMDAVLTWRVRGRHGVSLKYLGNRRDTYYPDAGGHSQRRGTLGIFYTLLGHDTFGAVEWRDGK
jgi:hypothetical protein